jgi:CheY-like chemotaxis protein
VRVLWVDHDAALRASCRRALAIGGIQTQEAACMDDALRLVDAGVVDLTVAHLRFKAPPDGHAGATLAKKIRDARPSHPVALYSGAPPDELRKRAEPAGASTLQIPSPPCWLRAQLRRIAGRGPSAKLRALIDDARSHEGVIPRVRGAREARSCGVITTCADELGMSAEWLRELAVVGRRWDDAALQVLLVDRRTRSGRRLSINHLVEIAPVPASSARARLVDLCLEADLTVKELRPFVALWICVGRS